MKWRIFLIFLLVGMWLVGCGGGGETVETAVTESPATVESNAGEEVTAPEPTAAVREDEEETAAPVPTEVLEEETETAITDADEPTAEILTTLTLTDVFLEPNRIFPQEALPIGECTELLVSGGTLTLYEDGALDFMPAAPDSLSDCFEFSEPFPLKGEHRIGEEGGDAILQYEFDEWFTVLQEGSPLEVFISGAIFERVGDDLHAGLVYFFVSSNGDSGNLLAGYSGDETYLLELAAVFAANESDTEGTETAVATVEPTPVFETTLPPVDAAAVGDDFTITGSANMVVVDELMLRFVDAGFTGLPFLNLSNGTSAGIASFCSGLADGVLASRPMTEDELAVCTAGGAEVLDFILARNPIVVIVHPDNDWATDMTADELATALTTAETWADVNAAWPAVTIDRYFPGIDSFPYNQVSRFLFAEDFDVLGGVPTAQFSEDDNLLLDSVANSEGAISFSAHSGFAGAQDVTAVAIDGVAPGSEDYLFDQPVILLTLDTVLQAKPQMAAFVNFALTDGRAALADLDLALVDAATQQRNEALWLEAVGE